LSIAEKLVLTFDRLRNRRRLWNLSATDALASDSPESLSELDGYLTICQLAATNDDYFTKFRSCSSYRAILENVDGKSGAEIATVMKSYGLDINNFSKLWHTEIGNPYKYHVNEVGYVAPTELRYSKVLAELLFLFGPLDGFSISEIGVGFGGQGGQILSSFRVSQYEFIDLPEPLQLVGRYLKEINQSEKSLLTEPPVVSNFERDLVISNYAFSELNAELQEFYLKKVIMNSRRGFVIYNHITPDDFGTMTASEFAARIPNSEIFPENPLSHPGNVLIVWGHTNKIPLV
jgi:hypothetical protein